VFTIGTFIYYGGVAWNREQQDQYMTKTMILLGKASTRLSLSFMQYVLSLAPGDLPRDHPLTGSHMVPPKDQRALETETERTEDDPAYPRPPEERMRLSDFAVRLRRAEIAQRKEDEASERQKERKEMIGGVQAVSGPGEMLRRRAERETERKEEFRHRDGGADCKDEDRVLEGVDDVD